MNVFIVDDLQIARDTLKKLLNFYFPEIKVLGESGNISEAVREIEKKEIDILFLDIRLGDNQNAFNILDNLSNFRGAVIMVTAYEEYALKAFKYGVSHYLLKPINPTELKSAIDKIRQKHEKTEPIYVNMEVLNYSEKITLPNRNSLELVPVDLIIYMEASGSYTHIFLANDRKIRMAKNLKYMLTQVNHFKQFIKVQKSFVVNRKYIDSYHHSDGGYLLLSSKHKIPVSVTYRDEVMKLFKKGS